MKLHEVKRKKSVLKSHMRACEKLVESWNDEYTGSYDISPDYLEMIETLTNVNPDKLSDIQFETGFETYSFEFSEDMAAYVMFGYLTDDLYNFLCELVKENNDYIKEVEIEKQNNLDFDLSF
jgi:hypothetical protein